MPAYNLFSRHRAGEIGCKSKGNVSHAECNVTTYPRTLQLANSITWFLGHVAPVVVLYASSIDISLSISFYLTISFLFYLYIRILPLIHSITLWLNTSCFIILLNQLYLLNYFSENAQFYYYHIYDWCNELSKKFIIIIICY